jgi:prolyl-tRNA synthetase
MKAGIINETGKHQIMLMGCYGIGISRVVAAAIEQHHDARGIVWPSHLAPFQVALCPMNLHKSQRLQATVEQIYEQLNAAGIETLLDDRKVRAGFMFSDMELIGIPHCIILSDKGLDANVFEYKARTTKDNIEVPLTELMGFIQAKLAD